MERKFLGAKSREQLRTPPLTRESVLVAFLELLAGDRRQVEALLDTTGLGLAALRESLADTQLQGGLLDYLLGHEDALIAVASALARAPEEVARAAARPPAAGADDAISGRPAWEEP